VNKILNLGGGYALPEVTVGDHESFESLLRRFNRQVQQEGILAEVRRAEYYEKPSIKKKRKEAIKRRKSSWKGGWKRA
jgi:small subunit ribosomal protein S21